MPQHETYAFVSYSSVDEKLAESLAKELDEAGITYFLDRKRISLGDNFKARISKGLERCTDLVLIASPSSLKSPWVFFELGQAIAFRRRIVTLLTHPGLELPSFLSDFQYANSTSDIIEYFKSRSAQAKRPRGLLIPDHAESQGRNSVLLEPSASLIQFMERFPPTWFHEHVAVDGAVELHTFPDQVNQYGGISREQCRTISTDVEWSDLALSQLDSERLSLLGKELQGWIGARRAKPNRIRFLVEPPAQMVLDNNEFQMKIGNSDYFTMRTVNTLSIRSNESSGEDAIKSVFDDFWGEAKTPFSATTVPYHISAQGVLFITDPQTGLKYLVLTMPSRQRTPLVPGWNVSFAEQMWAPSPRSIQPSWWENYVEGLTIAPPNQRTGDSDVWDTVLRGLYEELGIQQSDLMAFPKLIASCIEQDMYFVAFIFVFQAKLTLNELQKRRLASPDKEIGPIAAYPVEGVLPDGLRLDPMVQFTKLLSQPNFDGGPYLIPRPVETLVDRWHLSSRLRIYAAARNLFGNRVLDHVDLAI
ncbi:MAG: toll/interleukin-1 receptor domain-containing protein [Pseudomonadota bacterium]